MMRAAALLGLLGLSGAAAHAQPAPSLSPLATTTVQARGETAAVATADDAADDPAIWRNRRNPAASLIVATDKKAGLHVYDLEGKDRFFLAAGRVNNVDLRDMGAAGIIVTASDRSDPAAAKLALFRLIPDTAKLEPLARIDAGAGEAYGMCLYREGRKLYAFNVLKDGTIAQTEIDLSGATPQGHTVRTLKLATQSEGCVTDEKRHRLYVAEEDVGIWRFDAGASAATTPKLVGAADGKAIVADTEGLAIANGPDGRAYLVVSSQGDNAYAVYRLPDETYVGRFRVATGKVGSTEETDGIDLVPGNFGPLFPKGLLVIQDGHNEPKAQNFKLVGWDDVKRALKLR